MQLVFLEPDMGRISRSTIKLGYKWSSIPLQFEIVTDKSSLSSTPPIIPCLKSIMKFSAASLVAFSLGLATASPIESRATVQGFDISSYQPNVDFKAAYASGARFVIIKVG